MKANSIKWTIAVLVFAGSSTALATADHTDFKTAGGSVLIAAPTANNGSNEQGVWFLKSATKMFSLTVPKLASNQVYEGWIVDDCTGKKASTGLFRAEGGIDSDAAGRYAGPLVLNFPAAPGSDFVTLGEDITDGSHTIVITIEPYPKTGPNPSGVVVLKVVIPAGTKAGTELQLENVAQ